MSYRSSQSGSYRIRRPRLPASVPKKPDQPSSPEREAYDSLPERARSVVRNGIYGVGGKWTILEKFIQADPGRRLASVRELQDLSQVELANLAGVRQADVSCAENHFDDVSPALLEKLLSALKITAGELLFSVD